MIIPRLRFVIGVFTGIVALALVLGASSFAQADTYSFGPLDFGTGTGSVSGSFQYDFTSGVATDININLTGGVATPAESFDQFGGGCTPQPCINLSFVNPTTNDVFAIEINPTSLNILSTLIAFYPSTDVFPTTIYPYLGSATVTATPIPAALPLFASGLGVIGLLGWRRKRKAGVGWPGQKIVKFV